MSKKNRRILVIQRIFSNYRKPIFDRLSSSYDFLLLHSKNQSGITQTKAPYSVSVRSVKYGNKETNVFLFVLFQIIKFNPEIIIHEFNPSILSLHTSYIYSRLLGKKIILWGHGYNRRIVRKSTRLNSSHTDISRMPSSA